LLPRSYCFAYSFVAKKTCKNQCQKAFSKLKRSQSKIIAYQIWVIAIKFCNLHS